MVFFFLGGGCFFVVFKAFVFWDICISGFLLFFFFLYICLLERMAHGFPPSLTCPYFYLLLGCCGGWGGKRTCFSERRGIVAWPKCRIPGFGKQEGQATGSIRLIVQWHWVSGVGGHTAGGGLIIICPGMSRM